jgi:hypothetical protein
MANKSISQLDAGAAVSAGDLFPDVQTPTVGPVKVTAAQIGTFVLTGVYDAGFAFNTTSKTLSLGVASTTSGILSFRNSANAFTTSLQGSATTAASATYTLPTNVPASNGYILSSTTGGVMSWVDPTVIGIDVNIGTTAIVGGTSGGLLWNNGGVFGNLTKMSTNGVASITLGVQNDTLGTLVLANTAAAGREVTLQSSNSATASWTFTLPPAPAAGNGYILTSTTAGVTAWSNPTALGVDIDVGTTAIVGGTSGGLIWNNGGVVGNATAVSTNGTATVTLGIQQTTQGALVLANTAAGAYSVTVQASNTTSEAWTLTLPTTNGNSGQALITDGNGTTSWGPAGATINDDTTTNATRYPIFSSVTTGAPADVYVSSTKLTFNPSTGNFISTAVGSSNGIMINATTVSADYSIPNNYNGLSGGPVTVNSGITVTVPSGSTWTIV